MRAPSRPAPPSLVADIESNDVSAARVGDVPPHPLMEDLAFVHRPMSQGRLAYLDGHVESSPRRWVEGGLARAAV